MWQSADDRFVWQQPNFRAAVLVASPERGVVDIQILNESADDSLRPVQLSIYGDAGAPAAALSERYVRDGDLIATYAESPAEVLRPQIYWRMANVGNSRLIADLEILISLQTSRLESELTARSVTDLGPGEVWLLQAGDARRAAAFSQWNRQDSHVVERPAITLLRPRGKAWSYAEMVLPNEVGCSHLGFTPESTTPGSTNANNPAPGKPAPNDPAPGKPAAGNPAPGKPAAGKPDWSRLETSLITEQLEKGVIRRGRMRAIWLPREDDQQLALDVYQQFLVSRLPLTV
jgi:hypothetical protein